MPTETTTTTATTTATTINDGRGLSRRAFGAGAAGLAVAAAGASAHAANAAEKRGERPFAADTARAPGPDDRPNLLVILADDLGYGDLSSYGGPTIQTPNLDRLAASGVRFTDAYAASAVCSPTRVALYTGRYAQRLPGGLPEPIAQANNTDGIPPDQPTLASLLKGVGYQTAMVGKWHGGFLPTFGPLKSGWDSFYGNYAGGVDYFSKVQPNGQHDLYDGERPTRDPRYYLDVIADKAVDFVDRKHRRPWLLNLNVTSPHWPWERRGDKAISDELTARAKAGDPRALFHDDGGSLDIYREMVESMDAAIGRVLTALERSGQLRNTVVFFASDNGGERFSYNWPLTGNKVSVNEGGIRVPTILSWPGRLRKGQVSHEPVHTLDWHATFLALAGAKPDAEHPLDGRDLTGYLFRGRAVPEKDLFWRMRGQRALRRGDLKYVQIDGVDHLYDLEADVREQADLAKNRADDLASLKASWEAIDADLLPYPA